MVLSPPPTRCGRRLFAPCLILLLILSQAGGQEASAQGVASVAPMAGSTAPPTAGLTNQNLAPDHPHLFTQLGRDFAHLGRDPWFHLMFGGLMIAPAALQHEDPELNEAWAGEGTADHIFEFGDMMGNTIFPASASVLSYTSGRLFHSERLAAFGSDLFRAHLINAMATVSMKGITNRTRPDGSRWSFPSGHTSTAFTSAAVIETHFGRWWSIPAYAAATYVGLSRMQENRHYLSDVIAGAILGTYLGKSIAHRPDGESRLTVAPTAGSGGVGAMLTLRF